MNPAASEHTVEIAGSGPKVLFIHGGIVCGELTWQAQRPMSERWTILILDRLGYGAGQDGLADDHEADAVSIAARLDQEEMHLVGQSSGAIVAMRAASLRPGRVLSLTLCEPPYWAVASQNEDVVEMRQNLEGLFQRPDLDDGQWAALFAQTVGSMSAAGAPPARLMQGVRALRKTKSFPWNIDIDLAALRDASFPKLVVTGGHSAAFEFVGDEIAKRIGSKRAQLTGFKHSLPRASDSFNTLLDGFLSGAQAA